MAPDLSKGPVDGEAVLLAAAQLLRRPDERFVAILRYLTEEPPAALYAWIEDPKVSFGQRTSWAQSWLVYDHVPGSRARRKA